MSGHDEPAERPVPGGIRPYSRAAAEVAGTFLLVFGLVGAALLTSGDTNGAGSQPGTGLLGVALALGLAVTAGGYAFGPISGGHFNPAVTVGVAIAGRLPWRLVPLYLIAQFVGAVAGAASVFGLIAGGSSGFLDTAIASGFASNGYADLSPGGFGLLPVVAVEFIATAVLLFVVLATMHPTKGTPAAPLVIGLTLSSMLLVALPIDNASSNPARSLATALFGGGDWLVQVWVFILVPVIGGALAALVYPRLFAPKDEAVAA
ncbi:aquaporin [Amnibacterium flavum]|uniref:aquaporin n=1 Tax=Amnibacterium flavum TaxID=2173173 RepID=UPI001F0C805F|nr:aquaporin [Amnibacterium flavum]